MGAIINLARWAQGLLDKLNGLDFLAPLALRLYLVPVFWVAGSNKLAGFSGTVEWFGNAEWGLGLPFPTLLAGLATGTELIGAILLLIGLGVRWITLPLIFTMLIAIFKVHLPNGWQAVADPMSAFANDKAAGAIERLTQARELLQQHGNYDWLTETGSFVISNNGVEWAVTYLIMLVALFFIGAGKYVSVDYYIGKSVMPNR